MSLLMMDILCVHRKNVFVYIHGECSCLDLDLLTHKLVESSSWALLSLNLLLSLLSVWAKFCCAIGAQDRSLLSFS
jgi:hypothetical protein